TSDIWLVGVVDSSIVQSAQELTNASISFNCYPNPAGDYITVETKSTVVNGYCNIYDVTGHIIRYYILNENRLQVNTTAFSPGIYIVQVKDEKGNAAVKKLVKY
ncbi:MAG: T9SS type A sorting domain-containing protein, partial [Bacteroidota bacterium]